MFRKKKSRQTLENNANPTPSAASAAAQAFLHKQKSDANLSSAAAAAALRSHTTSPVPVADLQTKRMARRSSISSVGSPVPGNRQPLGGTLQRHGSSGSMTERTFRSPSPAATPPVPRLPEDIPPIPSKSARRLSSPVQLSPGVAPTAVGTNGDKPDPNKPFANRKPNALAAQLTSGAATSENEEEQISPTSPRSINFSRPMSPPLTQKPPTTQVAPRPSTSQGFISLEERRVKQQIQQAAKTPVSKNTQKLVQAQPGSHLAGAKSVHVQPSSETNGPAALAAATLASRPTPKAEPVSAAQAPSTVAAFKSHAAATPASTASKSSSRAGESPVSTPNTTHKTGNVSGSARPPAERGPSQDEIRSFQSRAAAHLARPLSDAAATAPATNTAKATVVTPTKIVEAPTKAAEFDRTSTSKEQFQTPTSNSTAEHSRSISQPTVVLPSSTIETERKSSVSPNRAARFSDSPVLDAIKHQPPPRSLSPAKSALKGSSPRTGSPADSARMASGEISDTRSISEDSSTPASRKKKTIRVSFEENAVTIGQAASPATPANNVLSPQYDRFPPGAFSSEDEDASMGPRPSLPSFGSVRGRKNDDSPASRSIHQANEPPPTTNTIDDGESAGTSTDRALAGVITEDFVSNANSKLSQEPDLSNELSGDGLPSIAVLPATPRLEDENVPFDTEQDQLSERNATVSTVDPASSIVQEDSAPAAVHTADAEEDSNVSFVEQSEDSAEVYSDAAEDLSDLEELPGEEAETLGGFASLDAIVESPAVEIAPVVSSAQSPGLDESPAAVEASLGTVVSTNGTVVAKDEDWDNVRAYWSSLSEQQKAKIEREAVPMDEQLSNQKPKPKKTKRAANGLVTQQQTGQEGLPPWPNQKYQESVHTDLTPPKQPGLSGEQESQSVGVASRTGRMSQRTMRGSFSDADADDERPTIPAPNSNASARAKARPGSDVDVASNTTASSKQVLKKGAKSKKPGLMRTFSSDSSDSDSSFKKRRTARAPAEGGQHMMKKTMRDSTQSPQSSRPTSPAVVGANRTSLRSLSPPDSVARKSFRSSLRNSTESAAGPTLRSSEPRSTKDSSFFGFGRTSKANAPPSKSSSRFKSRFADSSDEDELQPTFRSRFADSDDDLSSPVASPIKLTPVRGIPRKGGQTEGDSTELSDSDEGQQQLGSSSKTAAETAAIATVANGAVTQGGTQVGAPSTPGQEKKSKRGFWGLSKKQASPEDPSSASRVAGGQEIKVPRSLRSQSAQPPTNRNSFMRRFSGSRPTTPKGEPSREDYPFPPPPIPSEFQGYGTASERPNSATAAQQAAARPALGAKRDSSMTAPVDVAQPQRGVIVSERTGKKKKFQGLRRVFGLHD